MKGTRFPGVKAMGERKYLVRFKAKNHKTGKISEHKHVIEDCPSAAEAAKRRAKLQEELAGAPAPIERVRLSTFLDTWLISKKPELSPSTFDRYVRTLANHVAPRPADPDAPAVAPKKHARKRVPVVCAFPLGDYFLDAITHDDIVKWRAAQEGEPTTVNSRLRILKEALSAATLVHKLPGNPAALVAALPEDGGYTEEDPNSLTADQLAELLDAVQQHAPKWYALFAVLAFTGARVGEATALRWEDIEDETLLIRRSHWRGRVRHTTKTKKWRRVPVPERLAAILSDHRRALIAAQGEGKERSQARARKRVESGWIFASWKGTPTMPSVVRNALLGVLSELEKAAGEQPPLPHFTVHGLRRTMNNLLRQTVQDKTVVRAVVGHVTERMTEHYSTVRADEKAQAVAGVLRLVRNPRASTSPVEVEVSVEGRGGESKTAV